MPADEVLAGVAEILGSVTGVDRADITPATSLSGDLGLDSLLMVEVVVAAEDRFGLLIDDDDWPRFKTVLDAARYIEQAARPGSSRKDGPPPPRPARSASPPPDPGGRSSARPARRPGAAGRPGR